MSADKPSYPRLRGRICKASALKRAESIRQAKAVRADSTCTEPLKVSDATKTCNLEEEESEINTVSTTCTIPVPSAEHDYVANEVVITQEETSDVLWKTGRRIVELGVLANGLEFCEFCSKGPLRLSQCVREEKMGMASILYVRCDACQSVCKVPTGKQHSKPDQKCGRKAYDINTKLAQGRL